MNLKEIKNYYDIYLRNRLVIDFGSDTIKIACPNRGLLLEEASLIIVNGNKIVSIGDKAKSMVGKIPKTQHIINPILNSRVVDFDAAEVMLEYFLRKVNHTHKNKLFKPPLNIIVGSSSDLNAIEERNIKDLFFKIGASNVLVMSQTMLAAIGAGIEIDSEKCRFCLNIGASTSEFVIIANGNIVDKKILKNGGHFITKNIIQEILSKEKILISYEFAEKLKCEYAQINKKNDHEDILIVGQDKTFNVPKNINIKAKVINNAVLYSIREILNEFIKLLNKSSPEVIEDLYQNGIYLFGGTAKFKSLDVFISKILNSNATIMDDKRMSLTLKGGIKIHRGEF